jgi:hypothetical protein
MPAEFPAPLASANGAPTAIMRSLEPGPYVRQTMAAPFWSPAAGGVLKPVAPWYTAPDVTTPFAEPRIR